MQSPKLGRLGGRRHHQAGNNYRLLPLFVAAQGFFDERWRLREGLGR